MANYNAPESIAETIISKIGVNKCKLDFWQVLVLGILAGAYVALGAQLATRMASFVNLDKGLELLISGMVFSVGLMLIVIAGGELFTGNNLMFMSVLSGRAKLREMLLKWLIVYFANFLGAMLMVVLMRYSGLISGGVKDSVVSIAQTKVDLSFQEAFIRGILCNWLVCLAVWLALASHDVIGKIFGILFPITVFVASGFEHSIANMYFIPLGLLYDNSITWMGFASNLIPVTLGNIVGGAFFVATLYWIVFRKCKI